MDVIIGIGIGFNLLTIFYLLKGEKYIHISTKIAILINIIWTIRFVFFLLKDSQIALKFPILLMLDQNLLLLDSVVLWLYSKSLFDNFRIRIKTLFNFLPFLLGLFLSILSFIMTPNEFIIEQFVNTEQNIINNKSLFSKRVLVFIVIVVVISIIYFGKSLKEIKRFNLLLFNNFSSTKHIGANWVIKLHRLWILLFLIPIIIYFINYIYPIVNMIWLVYFLIIMLVSLSFLFNINVISQDYVSIPQTNILKKQDKSLESYKDQLIEVKNTLEQKQYYKDENLSLVKLSNYLDIKSTELTEIIKQSEFENFYDLINTYRIASIKKELIASEEQIIIIAYDNGFNSKSAFNRIFKNKTGQTPSEFRRLNQNKS